MMLPEEQEQIEKLRRIKQMYDSQMGQVNTAQQSANDFKNENNILSGLSQAAGLVGGFKPTANFDTYSQTAQQGVDRLSKQAQTKYKMDSDQIGMENDISKDVLANGLSRTKLGEELKNAESNPSMTRDYLDQLRRQREFANKTGDTNALNRLDRTIHDVSKRATINSQLQQLMSGDQSDPMTRVKIAGLNSQLNKLPKDQSYNDIMRQSKMLDATSVNKMDPLTELNVATSSGEGSGKQLPPATIAILSEGQNIPDMFNNIEKTIKENQSQFGPIRGRVGSINPYDTTAQSIDAATRSVSQLVGKYMEGGVLRKEDEVKYRAMLPNLKDTPEVALNKLRTVQTLLQEKQRAYIANLANSGYDVSAFETGVMSASIPGSPTPSPAISKPQATYKGKAIQYDEKGPFIEE